MLIERLHNVEARVETSVISTLIFFVKISLMARKHGKKSQDKELKRHIHETTGEFLETPEQFKERARNLFIDVGHNTIIIHKRNLVHLYFVFILDLMRRPVLGPVCLFIERGFF